MDFAFANRKDDKKKPFPKIDTIACASTYFGSQALDGGKKWHNDHFQYEKAGPTKERAEDTILDRQQLVNRQSHF